MIAAPHGQLGAARRLRARAFTLVEIVVVVAIIGLLLTILISVGSSVIDDAKIKESIMTMSVIDTAIGQFADDSPLKGVVQYRSRYGDFPCDELEPFDIATGIPEALPPASWVRIGPGGGTLDYPDSLGISDLLYRDTKAMSLAIRLYGGEAAAVLDKVSNKFRRVTASEFFDRGSDGTLNTDDVPLEHYVDAWGTPLEYYAVKKGYEGELGERWDLSAFLVAANYNRPLLVSFGPSGPDRMIDGVTSPLLADFEAFPHVIDNVLNLENVYIDEKVKSRLSREIAHGNP